MSQYPSILAGQALTAALLLSMLPFDAVKTGDTSVTSNVTLANDPDLVLAVAANARYDFYCYLDYEGGTLGSSDLKIQWNAPTGATLRFLALGQTTGGAVSGLASRLQATPYGFGTGGAGVLFGVGMWGTLFTGGTSGNLQLQWAQNTSSATATIVHAQSALRLRRTA